MPDASAERDETILKVEVEGLDQAVKEMQAAAFVKQQQPAPQEVPPIGMVVDTPMERLIKAARARRSTRFPSRELEGLGGLQLPERRLITKGAHYVGMASQIAGLPTGPIAEASFLASRVTSMTTGVGGAMAGVFAWIGGVILTLKSEIERKQEARERQRAIEQKIQMQQADERFRKLLDETTRNILAKLEEGKEFRERQKQIRDTLEDINRASDVDAILKSLGD